MRRKNLIVLTICLSILFSFAPSAAVYASEISTTTETEAISRAAQREWRYKVIDGKLYRRLYNITYQRWEGDWELCP